MKIRFFFFKVIFKKLKCFKICPYEGCSEHYNDLTSLRRHIKVKHKVILLNKFYKCYLNFFIYLQNSDCLKQRCCPTLCEAAPLSSSSSDGYKDEDDDEDNDEDDGDDKDISYEEVMSCHCAIQIRVGQACRTPGMLKNIYPNKCKFGRHLLSYSIYVCKYT